MGVKFQLSSYVKFSRLTSRLAAKKVRGPALHYLRTKFVTEQKCCPATRSIILREQVAVGNAYVKQSGDPSSSLRLQHVARRGSW